MTRRELRRENEDLRALLGLSKPRTIDDWEMLPQGIRDPLVLLYKDYAGRVFETPGGKLLKRDLGRLDPDREMILARMCQTALYGEDAESVRAATLLMKVSQWDSRGHFAPTAVANVELP
ncbi:MAG: hypothetical protein WBX26_07310 [Candidatus Cybelea sp.]